MYQGVLNRESLREEGGVKYFRDKLSHHFVKGAQSVFLWRFHLFIRARRGNTEMIDWIGKFSLLLKRVKDSWIDLFPLSAMTEQQRESKYQANMTRTNAERRGRSEAAVDSSQQATRDQWHGAQGTNHERPFPFSDNLTTWMYIVVSDLNEAQRETHKFLFSPVNECHCLHP